MSTTPADPYRGFMVNYAPHGSDKDANREDIISYGGAQLLQDRPGIRYHSDTTQPPFGPPSTFITNHSPPHQPGSYYNTHGYRLSPIQGSRKRQRTDSGPGPNEDTDHNYGYPPILQNLPMGDPSAPAGGSTDLTYADHVGPSSSPQTSNQDYLQADLQQQHHHHRLPSQSLVGTSSVDQGSELYLPQIDRSFMDLPGVPTPYPEPKAPKTRFGHKEDEMLVALKEHWKFSWRQIECFFPGRKQQTLQVRYCTKLKERDVVWDDALDQKLKKALEEYEDNKWAHIARRLGPGIPPAASEPANHRRSDQSGFKLAQPQTSKLPLLPQTPRVILPITSRTMFLQRTASALARRSPARAFTLAQRPFSSSIIRSNEKKWTPKQEGKILTFEEIKSEDDLFAPGAKPGTIPTDVDQATGLERLELIGKMQGIDIFDMRPLDASRKGSIEDPIIVNSAGDEQYAGCTGFPADSHQVNWLTVSRERPIERCLECGNVVKMNYIGPEEDPHAHDHDHGHHHPPHVEPKTFADYVKPDYWYR
ncbi:hypothetical protein N7537_000967 [Penicillium hordei]|uniref:Cytochrome c oxidase subunit 4, mitochondrial n=1 Tax=Penicillium hordei TaxID=40994 RepID=A0AAD6H6J3_9EURO|nr:uncharacterized protein N7537_000967 [Penicillium hordei]KAJ5615853.1 hypothetical protein N7537_000967 [Penicillium hordei]